MLIGMLIRFDKQLLDMHDAAQYWSGRYKTDREKEFWTALLRHVRGARLAIATTKYEIEVAQK